MSGDGEQSWVMVVAHLRVAAAAAQEVADELDHPTVRHLAVQIRLLGHAAYALSLADESVRDALSLADESVRDALERTLGGQDAEHAPRGVPEGGEDG